MIKLKFDPTVNDKKSIKTFLEAVFIFSWVFPCLKITEKLVLGSHLVLGFDHEI